MLKKAENLEWKGKVMQVLDHLEDVAPAASGPVVQTYGLTKQYKKRLAVNQVGLHAYQGDVFGLLGPNGAGKTTIIRMLLGLIAPSAGRAEVFGFDPMKQRDEVLRRVSAIVEAPALYPPLSGWDNLKALALAAGVEDEAKITEVLERINLLHRAKDRYATYSLGMKQRLCIAAALLTNPQLIILDEPTNGLDPAGMAEIRQLIRDLAGQGCTVFLSSHLLNEVQQVCNRVAVIKEGQIVAQGLVERLLAGKAAVQVRVAPDEQEQAIGILEDQHFGRVRLEGDYIVVEDAARFSAEINRSLAFNNIYAAEVTPRNQSLEEYYLELTQG
jgi:ABC-2 type transport system ATP-binding protein